MRKEGVITYSSDLENKSVCNKSVKAETHMYSIVLYSIYEVQWVSYRALVYSTIGRWFESTHCITQILWFQLHLHLTLRLIY